MKITEIAKTTRKLFSKSIGVLFVYTIIFYVISNYIFFPISRKLWSLSLLTVKEGYISDQNFTSIFTHPLVLLAGIFVVAGYCILCLWETAGIIMILEYSYRGHAVKLFEVMPASFVQIKHCLNPKNWLVFVYVVIVQPFVDSDFAGQMISEITVPEFIMDFILARDTLAILFFIALIVMFVIFVRYIFLPVIVVLEKRDCFGAAKKSTSYLQGRYISTYLRIIIAAFIGSIAFKIIPYVILYFIQALLSKSFAGSLFAGDISFFLFDEVFIAILASIKTVFIKIFVSAILIVIYHIFEDQFESEVDITLPAKVIKTEGKIRTFKGFIYSLYAVIFVSSAIMYVVIVKAAEIDPVIISKIISPTKIAAHKGYSSKAPENTLPAFALAEDCDVVDFIELDVRETKDGVPVVIHDANILSATGKNILVYDIEYDELKKLSATYGLDKDKFGDTRISALDEVLKEYADKVDLIIEIKANDRTPELPRKIVELMDKYGITETSMIHSGSYEALKAVKEINPDIVCGFIIAVSTGGYEDLPYADFFSVEHTYLSDNVISNIHKRGKKVYVWTVNEEASFKQVRSKGVDAVITDYPEAAYNGIHQYNDLEARLSEVLNVSNIDDIDNTINAEAIEYDGTGD